MKDLYKLSDISMGYACMRGKRVLVASVWGDSPLSYSPYFLLFLSGLALSGGVNAW